MNYIRFINFVKEGTEGDFSSGAVAETSPAEKISLFPSLTKWGNNRPSHYRQKIEAPIVTLFNVMRLVRLRLLAIFSLSAILLTGCVVATVLPPDPELVAPLPAPGCELAHYVIQSGMLVRHETTSVSREG